MATRTLQKTVQRIVSSLGDSAPATATSTSQKVRLAVDCVNDAVADIYGRAKWPFRLRFAAVTLQAGTPAYALPSDFGEFQLSEISVPGGTAALRYVPYLDLVAANPDWVVFGPNPPGNLGLVGASGSYGVEKASTPTSFTEWNSTLIIWPPPNAAFVAECLAVAIPYYCHPAELEADDDTLPLPPNLWPGCTYLALAYLKSAMDYPDTKTDENRAERMINKQLQRKTLVPRRTLRFKVG
jgi:hypothetical protein